MTISQVSDVLQAAMMAGLKVVAPILIISMLVGFTIALFQAATQIHEQSLTFVPKLLTIAVILIVLGPWMASTMTDFILYIFDIIKKLN